MTEIHITDPTPFDDDSVVEKSLRPSQFDEFIGQKELVDNLKLYIEAWNEGDPIKGIKANEMINEWGTYYRKIRKKII